MHEPLSAVLIMKSLDALSQRATVTAHNIANAGTPGYRPLRLTFEDALRAAAPKGADAVRAVKPQVISDPQADGLRLDLELADAASVAGRYGALVEILNRQLQLRSLVMAGGR